MVVLTERGYSFTCCADKEIVRHIKEKLAYVATDFEAEFAKAQTSSDIDKESEGIHKLAFDSIRMCDMDVRRDLHTNTVLGGGSTMFPGIEARLLHEMKGLAPASV
eukprot:324762_1